jgi:hypothetical protein
VSPDPSAPPFPITPDFNTHRVRVASPVPSDLYYIVPVETTAGR